MSEPTATAIGTPEHLIKTWRGLRDLGPDAVASLRQQRKLSDSGNADRFALDHTGEVVYVPGGGWYHHTSGRWAPDGDGEMMRRARKTAFGIRTEANTLDQDAKTKRLTFAGQSENRSRLEAMIDLAKSDPRFVLHSEHLDADPMLLNVANGTVDLRTGELRDHDPADFLSLQAPVEYDPDAAALRYERFLGEVFGDDDELSSYFARAVGYTITGSTEEHVVFLPFGPGANGKSVAVRALSSALGGYAATADVETFLTGRRDGGGPRPDLVRLRGVRAVFTSETTPDRSFDARLVKAISGGDPVVCRQLYHEPVQYEPAFALWVACNHLPGADGNDEAMWRRLRPIPFAVRIAKPDRRLGDKLARELPGILAWAVRGCLAWQAEGLGTCAAVEDATRSYRSDSSPFEQFVEDRCHIGQGAWVATRDLRRRYADWATDHGHDDRLTPRRMEAALRALGCRPEKQREARGWAGIRLAPHGAPDTTDTKDTNSRESPARGSMGRKPQLPSVPSVVSGGRRCGPLAVGANGRAA
ncbi:MAG: phage/plasmid primase, P4 family [Solirubrobacteraceae bacterium]